MIAFIDKMRDRFGVELVCRVMRQAEVGFLTARGYRAAKARPTSARRLRDELLIPETRRLHAENYGVYGVRKMHALLRRQGWILGRDQTGRLMQLAGVRGVKRTKKVFTTRPDPTSEKPRDLVQRRFVADAPRRLWVADVTYVATWSGFAYVAFVTDVFSRRIVGWNVASTLRADKLPLQALNMAAWAADGNLDGLVHHADHGSNYLAVVYTDRIEELGATPSTGTVGDSFDNAMAEAVNGLYKTELIRRRGPWRTVEQVELATLEYVWWWNNQRLHGELDMRTPAEVEADYYAGPRHPLGNTSYPSRPIGTKLRAIQRPRTAGTRFRWILGAVVVGSLLAGAGAASAVAQYSNWQYTYGGAPTWCIQNRAGIDATKSSGAGWSTSQSKTITTNCTGGSYYAQPANYMGAISFLWKNSTTICGSSTWAYNPSAAATFNRFTLADTCSGNAYSRGETRMYNGSGYTTSTTYQSPVQSF